MKRLAALPTLFLPVLLPPVNLHAEVQMLWSSPTGSIRQAGGVDYAPATWMAQLIYAGADDVKAPLNPASPFVPGGDDRVLRTQRLNVRGTNGEGIPGRIVAGETLIFADNSMAGHRVYTRVFNVDYAGLPDQGTPVGEPALYGDCPLSLPMKIATVNPDTILDHVPVVTVDRSTAQPVPVPIFVNGTEPVPSSVSCTLAGGFRYYLETTRNLVDGPWTEISGPHTGTGPVSLSIPAGLPSPSYLRVRTE
ncbi:MAG: hypothetical protein U1F77_13000 [Kiritimatiellia bacterium]